MAHARRKFNVLCVNHRSEIAADALEYYALLHQIERQAQKEKHTNRKLTVC